MKAMMKKPAASSSKKPALKKFAAGGAVAKKKPVKKYADGGIIPTTRQDPANSNIMPSNNVVGSMPKEKQVGMQQTEMAKFAPQTTPSLPGGAMSSPVNNAKQLESMQSQLQQQKMGAPNPYAGSIPQQVAPVEQERMRMFENQANASRVAAATQRQAPAPAPRKFSSRDALNYLRRTGNRAGAEEILKAAVGKQFNMPSDFAKGGVVKKKVVATKGKKK